MCVCVCVCLCVCVCIKCCNLFPLFLVCRHVQGVVQGTDFSSASPALDATSAPQVHLFPESLLCSICWTDVCFHYRFACTQSTTDFAAWGQAAPTAAPTVSKGDDVKGSATGTSTVPQQYAAAAGNAWGYGNYPQQVQLVSFWLPLCDIFHVHVSLACTQSFDPRQSNQSWYGQQGGQ